MDRNVNLKLRIPSKAQSDAQRPYIEHNEFVGYCKANNIFMNKNALERFEQSDLLFPCCRVIYPREYLRRVERCLHTDKTFKLNDEWKPLDTLLRELDLCRFSQMDEFQKSINQGHPIKNAIEKGHPYVELPEEKTFKKWDRYRVTVVNSSKQSFLRSKAIHFYSPWKIFVVHDLNCLNSYTHYTVAGWKSRSQSIKIKNKPSKISAFKDHFEALSDYSYRINQIVTDYYDNTSHSANNKVTLDKLIKDFSVLTLNTFDYKEWLRFLRKLIEIHQRCISKEQYIFSQEVTKYIIRLLNLLMTATNSDMEKMHSDYMGSLIGSAGLGTIDNITIYPSKFEKMFPTIKWELETQLRIWDLLQLMVKDLNNDLINTEQIPESIVDLMRSEMGTNPEETALAYIKIFQDTIDTTYGREDLLAEQKLVSSLRSLAIAIESQSKQWHRGNSLGGVLHNLFNPEYQDLINRISVTRITSASSIGEFLSKLNTIEFDSSIPDDSRCGRILLIAHLSRNFLSHNIDLRGKDLFDNRFPIYGSLLKAFIILFAQYKGL